MSTEPNATPGDSSGSNPTTDEVFHILSNARRRHVLHYLLQQPDGTATKRELAIRLVAWEQAIPVDEVTADQRKRMYISLHQTHLPQMADAGVIEYGAPSVEVELTGAAEGLRSHFDVAHRDDVPWGEFYLGLGLVASGLVAAAAVELLPFGWLPDLLVGALVAVGVTTAGAVHVYLDRQRRLGSDGPPPTLPGDAGGE